MTDGALTHPGSRGPGRVAVIGGGIGGLASAHFLLQAGFEVELFEAADRFGGLGTFFEHEGDDLDRFYHVILETDRALLSLMDDLGARDRAYWKETSLGFFYDRTLYRLNSPLDLLRFSPVPFLDRVRLGLTALWASYVARPGPLDDMTVEAWLTRLSGKRAFQRLWRPLLEAKFGDAYAQIPALWYWASFNREKGTKQEVKGYLRGGYKGLTDTLVSSLAERGAGLHLNATVASMEISEEEVELTVDGRARRFDAAVSTVPLTLLARMTRGTRIQPHLDRAHQALDYQGVVNVVVMLRRSATEHYWIPVVESGAPFQGIVETTRVIDLEDTGGRHLVYLMNYIHRTRPLYQRGDDEIAEEYVAAFLRLVPHLSREDVLDVRVFRAPFVEPLYTPGYGKRKPPEELVPGRVYLATSAQVYPDVTSWDSSTAVARRAVDALLAGSPRGDRSVPPASRSPGSGGTDTAAQRMDGSRLKAGAGG